MRFYLLHIVVLPIAVAALFGYQMYWRMEEPRTTAATSPSGATPGV